MSGELGPPQSYQNAHISLLESHKAESAPTRSPRVQSGSQGRGRRTWKQWEDYVWFDTWFIENVALMLCIGCTLAVGIVLKDFDRKQLPNLPHGITMNAIVSLLATTTKSAMFLVVSSAISQLKWVWFRKSRRLDDVQLYEDAARGPMGSIQMLLRHGLANVVSMGAVILILSLAFEPFIQQVLTYPNVPVSVNSSQAIVNRVRTFLIDDDVTGFPEALGAGLYSSNFQITPSYPTGNCKWDTFTSLGVCTTCGRADPLPIIENCTFNFNLTEAMSGSTLTNFCNLTYTTLQYTEQFLVSLDYSTTAYKAVSGSIIEYGYSMYAPALLVSEICPKWDDNIDDAYVLNRTFHGVSNPLLAVGIANLSFFNNRIEVGDSKTCTLNFCLRDLSIEFANGNAMVNVSNLRNCNSFHPTTSPDNNTYTELYNHSSDIDDYWCWSPLNNVWHDSSNEPNNGNMFIADEPDFAFCTLGLFRDWGHEVGQRLAGNVTQILDYSCTDNDTKTCTLNTASLNYFHNGSSDGSIQMWNLGPETLITNIAESLTMLTTNKNPTPVRGKAIILQTYVNVRWEWLILPTLLVVAVIIFFFLTLAISKKHNAPLWKNSILALLFHGLEDHELKIVPIHESASGMESVAAGIIVRLKQSSYESRTVLETSNARRHEYLRPSPMIRRKPLSKGSSTTGAAGYEMITI